MSEPSSYPAFGRSASVDFEIEVCCWDRNHLLDAEVVVSSTQLVLEVRSLREGAVWSDDPPYDLVAHDATNRTSPPIGYEDTAAMRRWLEEDPELHRRLIDQFLAEVERVVLVAKIVNLLPRETPRQPIQ